MSSILTDFAPVVALITAAGGIVSSIVLISRNSRDSRNELITGLNTLNQRLQDRIDKMETANNNESTATTALRSRVTTAETTVREQARMLAEKDDFITNIQRSCAELGLTITGIGVVVPPSSTTIIIIGAEEKMREATKTLLANHGYSVSVCRDVTEALSAAATLSPDTVGAAVIDLLTPGVDGISLANQLRLTPGLDCLPVIIILDFRSTSSRSPMQLGVSLPPGVVLMGFPYRQADLLQMVKDMIEKRQESTPHAPPPVHP